MKPTLLSDAIAHLRQKHSMTGTDIEIVREVVITATKVDTTATAAQQLFTKDQLQAFGTDVGKLERFVASDNGTDAIRLLTRAFEEFQ